jgi:hypothetical protein
MGKNMDRRTSKTEKAGRIDAEVKAVFEAKAAEPTPEHLIDLAHELDAPPAPTTKAKAG